MFGGVGVDVFVEGLREVFTAICFKSVACTVRGDGVKEVVNTSGFGDGGGTCNIHNEGEEEVETTEDQQVRVCVRIKEVTKGGVYREGRKIFVNAKSTRGIAEGRRHSDNKVGSGAGAGT